MWIQNEKNVSLPHSWQSTSMHYFAVPFVYACFVFLFLSWFAYEDLTCSNYQPKWLFGFNPTHFFESNLQYLDFTVMFGFFFFISSNLCMCMPACLLISVLLSLFIGVGGVGQNISMILHSYDCALRNESFSGYFSTNLFWILFEHLAVQQNDSGAAISRKKGNNNKNVQANEISTPDKLDSGFVTTRLCNWSILPWLHSWCHQLSTWLCSFHIKSKIVCVAI